jgi:hypothetical protein
MKNLVRTHRRSLAAFACGLLLTLPPLLAQDGAETPEALVAAAQKAATAKDARAIVRLVAPSERAMLAFVTDMGVELMSEMWKGESASKLKASYGELKKKYKVSDLPEGDTLELGPDTSQEEIDAHVRERAEKMYASTDVVAYVGDLMGLVMAMPEMADRHVVPPGALSDVKIEGDRATGKIGDRTLEFQREGGRWYLTAQLMGG